MRRTRRAGSTGTRLLPSIIFLIFLFFPALGFSGDSGREAHSAEILKELKEINEKMNKNHIVVVDYIASSGIEISSLKDFKVSAEEDIEDLKKKSSSCGLPWGGLGLSC